MKKKIIVLIAVVMMAVMGLVGCGEEKIEDDGNTLIYGSGDYTAINPALYEHGEINLLLFAGLTAHDENNNVVPGLAKEWTFDESTNTYRFTLREGLTFHDGEPLTAKDVKFTIKAIMNPDNQSENASNFEDIKSIKVIDDAHIDIQLTAPNVAMLDYLTIGILPEHLLKGQDMTTADFNQNPVGSGPYKMVSWDMGQSIVMEKFDGYYQGEPKIGKVVFKIVEDTDTRALQLKSGELNFAQITPKAEKKFADKEGFTVYSMTTADYRGIMYNFNNDLFKNNRELPAILSYAIDRQAIIDSVLLGHGQVAYSPLQAGEYNNENVEKYGYDPTRAEALLQEAGWTKGEDGIYAKGGQKLEFTINCSQGDQVRVDMANICAQDFEKIGVKVKVKSPAEIDWESQEAFLIGWGSPFDPDDHTYKVFGTDKGANYNKYSNIKVDSLLQQARELSDPKARKPLYDQFQVELADDPAYTFIAYIDAIYAGASNITGVTPDIILGHHGVGILWNIHEWEIK
ncbi:MAG: ABC transporter substrate-binding protein [Clostridiales bacterium]|nr:ABC transporter substrate-binding protein [Clostridiales bacterium]